MTSALTTPHSPRATSARACNPRRQAGREQARRGITGSPPPPRADRGSVPPSTYLENLIKGIWQAHGLGCQDCDSGSAPPACPTPILTGVTVDACVAMRAFADVLGEDITSV